MNFYHAAALALVGWYLMVPPMKSLKNIGPNDPPESSYTTAPLAHWEIADTFDSAEECKSGLRAFLRDAGLALRQRDPVWTFEQRWFARCIATDDPRLKGGK